MMKNSNSFMPWATAIDPNLLVQIGSGLAKENILHTMSGIRDTPIVINDAAAAAENSLKEHSSPGESARSGHQKTSNGIFAAASHLMMGGLRKKTSADPGTRPTTPSAIGPTRGFKGHLGSSEDSCGNEMDGLIEGEGVAPHVRLTARKPNTARSLTTLNWIFGSTESRESKNSYCKQLSIEEDVHARARGLRSQVGTAKRASAVFGSRLDPNALGSEQQERHGKLSLMHTSFNA